MAGSGDGCRQHCISILLAPQPKRQPLNPTSCRRHLHLWGLDHAAGGEQHARLLPELLVAKQQQQQQQQQEEEEEQQQQAALAPAACRWLTQAETVH